MSERTVATLAAGTLTVFTPAPISSGSTRGSAAASPHTETVIPASLPALATPLTSARTRGWAASPGPAAGSRRPSPSTSPVRSLVPIEKKSTADANTAAFFAVDSSSTMIPSGGTSTSSSAAVSVSTWRTRLTSRSELIMGISTSSRVLRPASSIARNWSASAVGCFSNAASPAPAGKLISPAPPAPPASVPPAPPLLLPPPSPNFPASLNVAPAPIGPCGQERRDLVAGEVEHPDGGGLARQQLQDRAELGPVLLQRRPVGRPARRGARSAAARRRRRRPPARAGSRPPRRRCRAP